jgi:hypothetical protein
MQTQRTTNLLLLCITVLLAAHLLVALVPRAYAQASAPASSTATPSATPVLLHGCQKPGPCVLTQVAVDSQGRLRTVPEKP